MLTKAEIESGLAGFTGTEGYHRVCSLMPRFVITDGCKWLADNAKCFWLFEAIMSHQPKCWRRDAKLRDFQCWTLTVKNGRGTLQCKGDSSDPMPIVCQRMKTDFPLDEITIWVEPQPTESRALIVAYLPSEH